MRCEIWHPLIPYNERTILVKGAYGDILYTEYGELVDAIASWWSAILGHRNPHIIEAIKKQLDIVDHAVFADFVSDAAKNLVELLSHFLPVEGSPWHIFFSDDGSTSIEVAIKGAYQYLKMLGYKKVVFIVPENDYHGDTMGCAALTHAGPFANPYRDILMPVITIPIPYLNQDYDFDMVLSVVEQNKKEGNGMVFVYEVLIQGSAGMKICNIPLYNTLLKLLREHGVILVADEVFTGLYRTGKPLSSFHFNVFPDVICLAKGVTGGTLPLGLTIFKNQIYETFRKNGEHLYHAHTYSGNPIACASACATLSLLLTPDIQNKINTLIAILHKWAMRMAGKGVKARTCGCVLAIEINAPPHIIKKELIKLGVYTRPLPDSLYIAPPYTIDPSNLEKVFFALEKVIERYGVAETT